MITGSILLIFLGCFVLINTSKKAFLQHKLRLEKWINDHALVSKIIGIVLFLMSFAILIPTFGLTSGIIYGLLLGTILLSLLTILYPLQIIKFKHIAIIFILFFSIEILIRY